jgi:hypothetical protein
MRKIVVFGILAVGLIGAGPAFAAGGMGDPSTVIREKNAICEMQRRGVGPLQPNMCLPELPVDAVDHRRADRRRPG